MKLTTPMNERNLVAQGPCGGKIPSFQRIVQSMFRNSTVEKNHLKTASPIHWHVTLFEDEAKLRENDVPNSTLLFGG